MPRHDTIVVGASAGGVPALIELARGLPLGLRATLLVVLHVGSHVSILPELLSGRGALPARHAEDGESLDHGRILVAPPDRHLVIEGGRARLKQTPKENFSRPAIDPLFRSAALERGARTIGVILSGRLDDGVAGLRAIETVGGLTVVQDPAEAESKDMPSSALMRVHVDHCLSVGRIADLLRDTCGVKATALGRPLG